MCIRDRYSKKKQIEYKDQFVDPNEPIRLNKFLANAGVCSRREADVYKRQVFRQFARAGLSGHHHLGVGDWFARTFLVGHFFHLVACGHWCVLLSFLSFVAKSFSRRSKVLLVADKS